MDIPIARAIVAATRPEESADAATGRDPKTTAPGGESTASRFGRIAMAGIGALLVRSGLKDRSLVGLVKAAAGGLLVYRGIRGRGRRRAVNATTGGGPPAASEVVEVDRSVTIDEPAEELSEMLRDPNRLSEILGGAAVVTAVGDDRYRWTLRGPMDRTVTVDTRIVEERPGELLRWESAEDSAVSIDGSVRFRPAPADRGTEIHLRARIDPPGGPLSSTALRRLNVVPETAAGRILGRFKSLAETGEIPTVSGNPSGRGKGDLV